MRKKRRKNRPNQEKMKTFPFKKSCRGLIHQTRALRKMKKKRGQATFL
jgi:hypothetical protein